MSERTPFESALDDGPAALAEFLFRDGRLSADERDALAATDPRADEIDRKARALLRYRELKTTIPSAEKRLEIVAREFNMHPAVAQYVIGKNGDSRVRDRVKQISESNSEISESNSEV